MRLPQAPLICEIFKRHFLKDDRLWLFGSRVDDTKRGGDIDLFIETGIVDASEAVDKKMDFFCDLQFALGEQRIDIVLKVGDYELPIYDIARTEGVRLV